MRTADIERLLQGTNSPLATRYASL